MSFLEIYNETIFDLLDSQVRPIRNAVRHGQRSNSDTGTAMTFAESVKRTTVELRTDKRGFVWPRNARYALVSSLADAEKFVELARANLQISKTALNAASSRSHAVFTIKLIKVPVCADPYVKDCKFFPISVSCALFLFYSLFRNQGTCSRFSLIPSLLRNISRNWRARILCMHVLRNFT